MKKIIFGLVLAAALILSSCGPRGGIVIVNNECSETEIFGGTATLNKTVTVTLTGLGKSQKGDVECGKSIQFDFADDGDYIVTVGLIAAAVGGIKVSPATVHVAGGNTVTVTLSNDN
jgi:hypothetical protein